jgi:hypothetical protein
MPGTFCRAGESVSTAPSGAALDASAAPFPRYVPAGPMPAAHSFEARDRNRWAQSTGVTDTSSAESGDGSLALSRLAKIGTMLRRSDIALAVGMWQYLLCLSCHRRHCCSISRSPYLLYVLGFDPNDVAVHPDAARILGVSDRALVLPPKWGFVMHPRQRPARRQQLRHQEQSVSARTEIHPRARPKTVASI